MFVVWFMFAYSLVLFAVYDLYDYASCCIRNTNEQPFRVLTSFSQSHSSACAELLERTLVQIELPHQKQRQKCDTTLKHTVRCIISIISNINNNTHKHCTPRSSAKTVRHGHPAYSWRYRWWWCGMSAYECMLITVAFSSTSLT